MSTIPKGKDAAMHWMIYFTQKLQSDGAADGIPPAMIDELVAKTESWRIRSQEYEQMRAAIQNTRAIRDFCREDASSLAERIAAILRANNVMPAKYGMKEFDTIKTRVRPPDVAPLVAAQAVSGRVVEIKFRGAGQLRRRPERARMCEIWTKVGGDPPLSRDDCRLLVTVTRSPYLAEFAEEQIGQTVYVIARWLSPRGEPGPDSEPARATIPI